MVKGRLLYELKTIVDTLEKPSLFVTEFYDNFQPLDTVVGKVFIEDKSEEFFAALRNKDSIVLKGYRFPYYDESHVDSLKHYIANFNYDTDTRHIQSHLIQRLGKLENEEIWDFFGRYYQLCYGNSMAQVKILQSLANQQNEVSTKIILDLMAKDLPLVSNSKEITKIFKPYRDNIGLAKMLFPKLLNYSSVHEYKVEIISLLADLKTADLIKSSVYKKYLGQMKTDARIQLKRHLGRQGSYHIQRSSQQLSRKQNSQILEDYAVLLFPYKNEKDVQQFFVRLLEVKAPNVRATHANLMAAKDEHTPLAFIDSLAGDINSRALIFNRLKSINKLHLFPSIYHVQEALAESAIFEDRNFIASKDEVIYLGKKDLEFGGKDYHGYYFKLRSKQDFDKNYKVHLVVYESGKEVSTDYFYKNDGYRMTDMDTDEAAMDYVNEEFELKDRSRAVVYHPESSMTYNRLGF